MEPGERTMATADRKQREKEQRRIGIINAAEKLFYEKGFDNVTMDEIAEAVELSKGSLYLVFRNKDSLFFAIVARHEQEFLDELIRRLERPATGREKLQEVIRCNVDLGKAHPGFAEMASTYAPVLWSRIDRENEAVHREIACHYNEVLRIVIAEGIHDGSVRDDLDPVMLQFYLTLSSMAVIYPLPSWKKAVNGAGIPFDRFIGSFCRFIEPSIGGCQKKAGRRSKQVSGNSVPAVNATREEKE
jgi:AcrR family transcriptional regulator